jgi:hypothetical protein
MKEQIQAEIIRLGDAITRATHEFDAEGFPVGPIDTDDKEAVRELKDVAFALFYYLRGLERKK